VQNSHLGVTNSTQYLDYLHVRKLHDANGSLCCAVSLPSFNTLNCTVVNSLLHGFTSTVYFKDYKISFFFLLASIVSKFYQ